MKQQELAILISNQIVSDIAITRCAGTGWVIRVGRVFDELEDPGEVLELARSEDSREWSSVDSLLNWLRGLGWSQSVTVLDRS